MRASLMLMPAALILAGTSAFGLDYQTLETAQSRLYPGATLIPADFTLSAEQVEQLKNVYDVPVMRPQVKAWRASTGGWLFLDQVYGLSDIITYLVAVDDKGAVKGTEIVVCAEGFCDIATPEWRGQFLSKVSGRWDPKSEISNISGASLSSTHVAEGVKKVLAIAARYMPHKAG